MIATKDHFLFIIKNSELNDELYAAEGYPEGNPIGFFAEGNAATFSRANLDEQTPWVKYSDSHDAPNLHIRSENSLFGAVAKNVGVTYFTIIPREGALAGEWKKLHNANDEEYLMIQNSDTSFQVGTHCNVELYRDFDTFELIDAPETSSLDIDLTFD
jgi:hypothetical protein